MKLTIGLKLRISFVDVLCRAGGVLELSKRKPAKPAGFCFVQTRVSSGNIILNTSKLFETNTLRSQIDFDLVSWF